MTYPFGTPDQWQNQELEQERYQRALAALRWARSKAQSPADGIHLGVLCYECGISTTEVFQKEPT